MDLKIQCEHIVMLCHGCLSADRKITCLTGQNKALFFKLRNEDKSQHETKDVLLCWECKALLNKIKIFQSQIQTAQVVIIRYLQTIYDKNNIPHTLSKLHKKPIKYYDQEYIFNEEEKAQTEENKQEIEITIEEKQEIVTEPESLGEIKQETESIKEENDNSTIDSFDDSTDFYVPILKIERDDTFQTVKHKKKASKDRSNSIKQYAEFATVTKKRDLFTDNVEPYSEIVFLNEIEMQEVLQRDCKSFSKGLPNKCKICDYGFKRRMDFLRHKTFHHSKSKYPTSCLACQESISSESELEQHWKTKHSSMLKCNMCSELCRSKGEMKKHLNRAHTKIYTCISCYQEFGTLKKFSVHYKKHHNTLVCDYCNGNFKSKRRLEAHIKRNHLPPYCAICRRSFSSYHSLETHGRTYHPELMACDTRKEMSYCVECDKQFPSIYKYKKHLKQSVRHTPRKKVRIPCPECNKIFTRKTYMNNHYRLIHIKDTKHYCDLCNKHFANGYGLRKHIEHVHQKVAMPKDKICDLCGRGFSTNRILINHRRTHTGERPFKCKYCPASFAQETAMKTHQKTQHKNFLEIVPS